MDGNLKYIPVVWIPANPRYALPAGMTGFVIFVYNDEHRSVGTIKSRNTVYFLDKHNITVMILPMNSKQMKKWLEQQGASFQVGKGSHLKVFLNGKQSALPMHGTAELGKGLEAAIKRQLGLK